MGYAIKSDDKNVMLDIEREIAFWRLHYAQSAFHRSPRPFESYAPTLKFGYDMYLLGGGCDLAKLLPAMRVRYEATDWGLDHLEWPLAEAVIRETWKRMQPGINCEGHPLLRQAHMPPRPGGRRQYGRVLASA